ncbi:RAD51-associated protein 1 isoform X4 [Pseudonaja textilis]|uniref:RAD51-associated protein 1 isoform X4 n=1 Tax=Pseudonaja textilis TaxID=8673 RepID=UPI000EA8C04F|nr:RAD51-associated protein 1 isoform X4 [Pseudonaja textilis]
MARRSGRSGRAAPADLFQESDGDEDFAAPPKKARPAGKRVPLDDRAETKAAVEDFKQETVLCTPETDNDENLCANQENSQPLLEIELGSSESVGKPLKTSSPSVPKKPSWTPPGASGSKTSLMGRTPVRSPVHSLRLGLSRLARVKPLHPPCAGT